MFIRGNPCAIPSSRSSDNLHQAVAGQMMGFFAEVGCVFPPLPCVAHSRGWSAEDMERNVEFVSHSEELRDGTRALVRLAWLAGRRFIIS